jgi:hypothetical protein
MLYDKHVGSNFRIALRYEGFKTFMILNFVLLAPFVVKFAFPDWSSLSMPSGEDSRCR